MVERRDELRNCSVAGLLDLSEPGGEGIMLNRIHTGELAVIVGVEPLKRRERFRLPQIEKILRNREVCKMQFRLKNFPIHLRLREAIRHKEILPQVLTMAQASLQSKCSLLVSRTTRKRVHSASCERTTAATTRAIILAFPGFLQAITPVYPECIASLFFWGEIR